MSFDSERRTVLGTGLKIARKRAGLSAKKAAGLLFQKGLRCTRGTLLAWERGGGLTSREPFASDLVVIASVYDCTVQDFFTAAEFHPAATDSVLEHADLALMS